MVFTPHLCPIVSVCLERACSARDADANCTYPSPVDRPCPSCRRVIPFGTISNPLLPEK